MAYGSTLAFMLGFRDSAHIANGLQNQWQLRKSRQSLV
jgi:hypothetical protein